MSLDPETEEFVFRPPPTRSRGGDGGSRMSGAPPRSPRPEDRRSVSHAEDRRSASYADDRTQADRRRTLDARFEEVREVRSSTGPRSTVVVDEDIGNGERRRVIEEVDADGRKRIVEEKYVIRKRT